MKYTYTLEIKITQKGEEIGGFKIFTEGPSRSETGALKLIKKDINSYLRKEIEKANLLETIKKQNEKEE